MPTAARKEREAEKRRQAEQDAADLAEFDRQLALLRAMREDLLQVGFSANNDLIFELPSYTHMKGGLGGCDENGNAWHHPMVGKAGSAANADNALDRAKSLKRKFPHLWGKGWGWGQTVIHAIACECRAIHAVAHTTGTLSGTSRGICVAINVCVVRGNTPTA